MLPTPDVNPHGSNDNHIQTISSMVYHLVQRSWGILDTQLKETTSWTTVTLQTKCAASNTLFQLLTLCIFERMQQIGILKDGSVA